MPYFYSKDERVLVEGFKFGTVYQDQDHRDETIRVVLDRAKHTVVNVAKGKVQPMSAEDEQRLNVELNRAVKTPIQGLAESLAATAGASAEQIISELLSGNPWEIVVVQPFTAAGSISNGEQSEWEVGDHSKRGPYRDIYKDAKPDPEDTAVKAEPFRYKKGDRVKFKYNRSTGTVVQDQHPGKVVRVQWDGNDSNGREKKSLWEIPENLTALYIPRATDPVNPHQAEIDAIDAIRLPLIAELEARQAVLSKLTAAKKILQKNG